MRFIGRYTKSSQSIGEQKQRLVLVLALICAGLFLPFVASHFLESQHSLGVISLVIIITFLTNAVSVARKQHYNAASIQFILVPAIVIYLLFAIKAQGILGALWCYPAILSFYFLLSEKQAWIANILLLILVSPLIMMTQETETGWRIVATCLVVSFLSGFFINIISKQRQKLQHLAITDPLTGLLNRQNLANDINAVISQVNTSHSDISLIMVDIDHFKSINDSFGHETGDVVLQKIADVFKSRCRKTDKIYRIGGEEFLLLIQNAGNKEAQQLAETLRRNIAELRIDNVPKVTASFGITAWKKNEPWQSWLSRSDNCLYKAKSAGRNCVVYCD